MHNLIYGTFATGDGAFHAEHNHTPSPPASPNSNTESHKEDESFIDPALQSSQDFEATQAQSSQVCFLHFMHQYVLTTVEGFYYL